MFIWKTGICSILASVVVATAVQAQDINMRLHTLVKSPHPYNDMAAFMADEVSSRSNGAINIKIFDAAQLGKDDTVIGEMGLGTIDLMISSTNNAAKKIPEFQLFSMPYLFSGFDDLMAKVGPGSGAEAYYQTKFSDYNLNMQLLALGGSGTRNLSNSKGPVLELKDIAGFKMRTPPSPMISKTWAELGTLPSSVAWGELYAAVQTGVVDAFESSIPGYTGAKLFEVAPFLSLTAHTIQVNHISMSDRAWGKLSDEQKAMFVTVAQEATLLGIEKAKQYEVELVKKLEAEHNVTVSRPDTSEFQSALSNLKAVLVEEQGLEAPMAALNK
ncbi:MAG: TRAP transporter substrate-binding protein [Hyphomicrobiales bacterium]